MITGQDLIEWGFKPGPGFKEMIARGNTLADQMHCTRREIADLLRQEFPEPPQPDTIPMPEIGADWTSFLHSEPEGDDERVNARAVLAGFQELMRTPVLHGGAVLPDACPSGPHGTIPVGGVAVSSHIHPGMHSADICCSMFLSVLQPGTDPKAVLDRVQEITHFGPGGRKPGARFALPPALYDRIMANPITAPHLDTAVEHLGTQGDGNHFAYVGRMSSTDAVTLVTHHGSRGFGAKVYKTGMKMAEAHTKLVCPEALSANAWIDADSDDGRAYWEALQIVREWTKLNHRILHDLVEPRVEDRFWNEHNFVFRKSDGLFYHAKGATPTGFDWADDYTDTTIIPLNMAQPILLVEKHPEQPVNGFGFAPHGAGRNISRTAHMRRLREEFGDARGLGPTAIAAIIARETKGVDCRFFCGIPDLSELPSAYKDAVTVRREIGERKLGLVVDTIEPYGAIMAGDWERDAPWKKKRAAKLAAKQAPGAQADAP